MKKSRGEFVGMRYLFLLLIQFTGINYLWANGNPVVTYLGIEQGLSNNAVSCIYQDHKGFMWFGTYDGLNRYDGYEFKVFRNKIGDTTTLLDNMVYNIEGDKNHNLWIGGRKGISIFNSTRQSFSRVTYTDLWNHNGLQLPGGIHSIKMDGNGDILVGTENKGLVLFANSAAKGRQVPLLHPAGTTGSYEVSSIEVHENKQYDWVFVVNEGLALFDRKQKAVRIINANFKKVNCLRSDKNGHLWIGTDYGLYRYDIAANSFSQNYFPQQSRIVSIKIDSSGTLWLASDGDGIFTLPPGSNSVLPFLAHNNKMVLSSKAVFSIYDDNEGRKWIGTLRGGINIIEPRQNPFKTVSSFVEHGADPTKNFINTFCETPDHNLWIGTSGDGLKYWNRNSDAYTYYKHQPGNNSSISSNLITYVLDDFRGDTWIATWNGGINKFHRASQSFEHFTCFNPQTFTEENNVWLLYQDSHKTLWASTTNNGTLYTLNRGANKFELFDNRIVNVQCLTEDKKGTLWGGNYTSLIKIDPVTKKHLFYQIGYTIRSIHEDKRGDFWIGTDGGGLLKFNRQTGTYARFTMDNGLPNNTILRILEDEQGNLWLSTFNGLSKFDPQKKLFRNFSQSDGLQSNQFSFNAALTLPSGEFLFGGIKGFNIFYPDSVYGYKDMPKVYLTDLKINNVPVEKNEIYVSGRSMDAIKELKIPYDQAVISFNFAALEYSAPDKIRYAYYLQGWDKGWNDAGKLRTANYTRLQEGRYLFKIKNTNADGMWSKGQTLLRIVVLPPWYRTWWAYLFYLMAMVAAISIYIRYTKKQERLKFEVKLAQIETEKEKQLNEKKFSFFTHIAHEFRTPLTLIINPVKDIIEKNSREGINNAEINIVHRNARRLLGLVDQLLHFRKSESEADSLKIARLNFYEVCKEVYLCFVQQAKSKKIVYEFECSNQLLEVFADHEKIEIALYNLISNALKYTPVGGKVLFKITETNNRVEVTVADTGCGIPETTGKRLFEKFYQVKEKGVPAKPGFGIGLYLAKYFVESHKGEIFYTSELNKGTTFTLWLQKGNEHFGELPVFDDVEAENSLLEEPAEEESSTDTKSRLNQMVTNSQSMLVVDDNAPIRQYVAQIFKENFTVYEATSGEEGLKIARQYQPDLIISDVVMQGMNGVELVKSIKEDAALSHIPVILLTGSSSAETKLKGVEGGADDYITKPFEKDLLVARVSGLLKSRENLQRYFYNEITLQKNTLKISSEYKEFLDACIAIVEKHLDDDNFTIKTLATELGMSHSKLYKKVKSVSGQSVNGFIRFIRLRKAAELMINTNLNVNETAQQVGMNDLKYFREQFYKLFGMNPSEYIKKYREVFGDKYLMNKKAIQ